MFGLVAYFVPFVIVLLGWIFFWKPQLRLDIDFLNVALRIIGFIFTLFSMTAIASLNFNDFHYYPSGGLIGDIVAQSMLGFFSLLAVNLISLTLFVCGITLLMGFSWIRLIDGLGATAITGKGWQRPDNIMDMLLSSVLRAKVRSVSDDRVGLAAL